MPWCRSHIGKASPLGVEKHLKVGAAGSENTAMGSDLDIFNQDSDITKFSFQALFIQHFKRQHFKIIVIIFYGFRHTDEKLYEQFRLFS